MPDCGSQVFLCDVPIRFDTYEGCSHDCKYCFASRKKSINVIKKGEGKESLINFINGKRNIKTNWADWDIPLHWGGMSDPFQPCEEEYGNSYECLKIFRETQYHFIVSTKGKLLATDKYLDILKDCNVVVQISLVSPKFDDIELGCPTFNERIEMIKKIAPKVKRLNVRIQPYMREAKKDILKNLKLYKEIGVYGIILEGMKFKKASAHLEHLGGDSVYPLNDLEKDFSEIKKMAHSLGLKFYCGENRLRNMGDNLCCCGIEGLDGFNGNNYNLNHLLYDEKTPKPTEAMLTKGSGLVFVGLGQNTTTQNFVKDKTFKELMDICIKDKEKLKILGKLR